MHVGYFVDPAHRVARVDPSSRPEILVLDRDVPVLTFGSTGGGGLFVVECETGAVYLLDAGELRGGRYLGGSDQVKYVAPSVAGFLERLLADLTAFVDDDANHSYVAGTP